MSPPVKASFSEGVYEVKARILIAEELPYTQSGRRQAREGEGKQERPSTYATIINKFLLRGMRGA